MSSKRGHHDHDPHLSDSSSLISLAWTTPRIQVLSAEIQTDLWLRPLADLRAHGGMRPTRRLAEVTL